MLSYSQTKAILATVAVHLLSIVWWKADCTHKLLIVLYRIPVLNEIENTSVACQEQEEFGIDNFKSVNVHFSNLATNQATASA